MGNARQWVLGAVAVLMSCAIVWQAQASTHSTAGHPLSRVIAGLHIGNGMPAAIRLASTTGRH